MNGASPRKALVQIERIVGITPIQSAHHDHSIPSPDHPASPAGLRSDFFCLVGRTTCRPGGRPGPRETGTSAGDITLELYPDQAPKTVENFVQYVKDKHYDGTIFHRVIENFMVQGGGFDASYVQKKTRPPVVHEGP
jgi:hypothetical protein